MIYGASTLVPALIQGLREAGAPGAIVPSVEGRRYNPVHELARGFATVFGPAVETALASSGWVVPSGGYPTPTPWVAPAPGLGAPTRLDLTLPEIRGFARQEAREAGWTGPASHVLFEGLYLGIRYAASRSSYTLSTPSPIEVPSEVVLQLDPAPLNEVPFSAALAAVWSSNPLFAGGEPQRRRVLARCWARVANTAWLRTRPALLVPDITPGALAPPYPLVVVPPA